MPPAVLDRLIQHFGNLQGLLAATAADLQAVEGVGEARARVSGRAVPAGRVVDRGPLRRRAVAAWSVALSCRATWPMTGRDRGTAGAVPGVSR